MLTTHTLYNMRNALSFFSTIFCFVEKEKHHGGLPIYVGVDGEHLFLSSHLRELHKCARYTLVYVSGHFIIYHV